MESAWSSIEMRLMVAMMKSSRVGQFNGLGVDARRSHGLLLNLLHSVFSSIATIPFREPLPLCVDDIADIDLF